MGKEEQMERAVSDMPLPAGRSLKCRRYDYRSSRALDRPHDQKALADGLS